MNSTERVHGVPGAHNCSPISAHPWMSGRRAHGAQLVGSPARPSLDQPNPFPPADVSADITIFRWLLTQHLCANSQLIHSVTFPHQLTLGRFPLSHKIVCSSENRQAYHSIILIGFSTLENLHDFIL